MGSAPAICGFPENISTTGAQGQWLRSNNPIALFTFGMISDSTSARSNFPRVQNSSRCLKSETVTTEKEFCSSTRCVSSAI